jgi:hypothetical protein
MKKAQCTLALAVSLALGWIPGAIAQHPAVLVNDTSGLGVLEWHSASEILHPDGTVRSSVVDSTRRRLEEQFAWFDERFGGSPEAAALVADPLPSGDGIERRYCMPWPVIDVPPPEVYGGDFETKLLLSEVAVLATISDFIPGFSGAAPDVLVALSEVAALHDRSRSPAYFLLPVGQFVTNGRVFCGGPEANDRYPNLKIGDRIVLLGRWDQGVVWTGGALTYDLAVVVEDESLLWQAHRADAPPKTLPLLRQRVDEAVQGGLLDMTAPLRLEQSHSPKRLEFSETWWNHHQGGCRIKAARELEDGNWELTQTCGSVERRIER